jgi:hypothetical protein
MRTFTKVNDALLQAIAPRRPNLLWRRRASLRAPRTAAEKALSRNRFGRDANLEDDSGPDDGQH